MINLIPGKKGTGKTKILVDSIKKAAEMLQATLFASKEVCSLPMTFLIM